MRIIRIFTDPWLSTETARVIKSVTLFHQRPYFRHVRQVLFLLFLASQTAGGSRGVLVHVRHPKFPKNRQQPARIVETADVGVPRKLQDRGQCSQIIRVIVDNQDPELR